jgi:acetyltransferase-like isoleucine patch superfamily enzyme
MINRYALKLALKKFTRFGDRYRQGSQTVADLSQVLIHKNDTGSITLGNNIYCNGQLYCFFGKGHISIGDFSYIGEGSKIWALSSVTIGNRVLISHNVFIVDNQTHPVDPVARHLQYKAKFGFPKPDLQLDEKPIVIEDDVWIAANAIILRGVHIGKGAIIGAGAVVTRDVKAGTTVAGNPAKEINRSFDK